MYYWLYMIVYKKGLQQAQEPQECNRHFSQSKSMREYLVIQSFTIQNYVNLL